MFLIGSEYSRKEIWGKYFPDKDYPNGGPWVTGYASAGSDLVVFANISTPGRTGHDFPNTYDHESMTMTWYGKPNAHSSQPLLKEVLDGERKLNVFARWNNKHRKFLYLGIPSISSFTDNISLPNDINSICFKLDFSGASEVIQDAGPDGKQLRSEGTLIKVEVNKYERDPSLRSACLEFYGPSCQICDFNFEATYGELGKDYCHIHHLNPLSETNEEVFTDPVKDLIPVCPNCHAMLHRKRPALTPSELKKLLLRSQS